MGSHCHPKSEGEKGSHAVPEAWRKLEVWKKGGLMASKVIAGHSQIAREEGNTGTGPGWWIPSLYLLPSSKFLLVTAIGWIQLEARWQGDLNDTTLEITRWDRTGQKNTDNGSWKEAGGKEQECIIIGGKIKLGSVSLWREYYIYSFTYIWILHILYIKYIHYNCILLHINIHVSMYSVMNLKYTTKQIF